MLISRKSLTSFVWRKLGRHERDALLGLNHTLAV